MEKLLLLISTFLKFLLDHLLVRLVDELLSRALCRIIVLFTGFILY